jgi:RNA polymerase sigma-70 factor (ECF subfamily)
MPGSEPAKNLRPHNEADERLLIEAAQSDPARFADVYEKYFDLVYAYVARRMRDRARAEDLTSEVFHKAFANLPRYKWTGAPFAAWLFRIAANLIADRAKRKVREGSLVTNVSESSSAVESQTRKQSQQIDLEQSERRARLFKLVDGLGDDQRQVIAMRFSEEKSIKEIANEIGRSEGAVKQLQFRALQTLRARITSNEL